MGTPQITLYPTTRTQKDIIVDCLEEGESITEQKMRAYGIKRLAHYIWWLRKFTDMFIVDQWETDREGKRYKSYWMVTAQMWN